MTRHEIHEHPIECCYKGDPGIVSTNPEDERDYLYFVSNSRDGMICRALLKKYPQYKCTYALTPSINTDGHIDFERSGITMIKGLKGELIFKKPTKFSL